MVCQKCGAKVDADDEFCPDCGAKIRAQPTEALPARQAMLIAVQPKKHWFLKTVLIFIIIIFLVRACANFASEPQVYRPIQEVAAPSPSERLISIDTPPPRVNPIPEPEPLRMSEQERGIAVASCKFACTMKDESKFNNPGFSELIVKAGFSKCTDFPEIAEMGNSFDAACNSRCGDGKIQEGENCSNCPYDVRCASGESCEYNVCTTSSSYGYDATYDMGY